MHRDLHLLSEHGGPVRSSSGFDLPPLKWSSLKYDFWMEDKIDGEEEAYG